MGIKQKLIIAFLAIALIPTIIAGVFIYHDSYTNLTNSFNNHFTHVANIQKSRVQTLLELYDNEVQLIASRTYLRSNLAKYVQTRDPAVKAMLNIQLLDSLNSVKNIHELLILDLDGSIVACTDPVENQQKLQEKSYFREGLTRSSFIDVTRDRHKNELITVLTAPIQSGSKMVGMLVMAVNAADLINIVNDHTGLGESGETTVAKRDANGDALFIVPLRHDANAALNRRISAESSNSPIIQALRGNEGMFDHLLDYQKNEVISATRYIERTGWGLVVKIDKVEALAPLNRLRNILFAVVGGISLLVVAATLLLAERVAAPLIALSEAAVQVGRGNLHQHIEINTKDEVGLLARTFNEMSESLYQARVQIEENLQQLAASEVRFRSLFEETPNIPVQGYDRGHRVIYWNRASELMYGYSKTEALGRRLEELIIPPPLQDLVANAIDNWINDGEHIPAGELDLMRKDGSLVTVYSSHVMITNLAGEPEMFCIDIDLSERKKAEEAVRKLNAELEERVNDRSARLQESIRELEGFCYAVSHDLRAPLARLQGYSQALLEDCAELLNDQGRHYVERIDVASRQLRQTVDALLELNRLSRNEINWVEFDLSELAAGIAAEIAAGEPGRQVTFTIQPDIHVYADPRLLSIVLENLLSNAWKFTTQKSVANIELGTLWHDGETAYFVRDNGAGFDMQFSHKLYQAFQRLHSQIEFPGSGIGLATVQRIILRHGGKIWAEGRVDHGATFYFTIGNNMSGAKI